MSESMQTFIPYGKQSIDDNDVAAVIDVLKSDFLTTGPKVAEFESAIADFVGIEHAVAVANGTAGLHAAMHAIGIHDGDEVIVPPMTFAATSNAVIYEGGTPVFADVRQDTLLLDPALVEERITERTKAIIAVDYAGQPCDYRALREIADRHDLVLVSDACHSLGGAYDGAPVGALADLTVFSFHPVKPITTGEGGMIVTDCREYADKMRSFRGHGIVSDYREREEKGTWFYEMTDLGFNYRITDFQCALGISQLKKLPDWVSKRQAVAAKYDVGFSANGRITPLKKHHDVVHAYHLYVVRLPRETDRRKVFEQARAAGIGVNVHYIPVHLHPYYRQNLGTFVGQCPVAEQAYEQILSLPIYPSISDAQVQRVMDVMNEIVGG